MHVATVMCTELANYYMQKIAVFKQEPMSVATGFMDSWFKYKRVRKGKHTATN